MRSSDSIFKVKNSSFTSHLFHHIVECNQLLVVALADHHILVQLSRYRASLRTGRLHDFIVAAGGGGASMSRSPTTATDHRMIQVAVSRWQRGRFTLLELRLSKAIGTGDVPPDRWGPRTAAVGRQGCLIRPIDRFVHRIGVLRSSAVDVIERVVIFVVCRSCIICADPNNPHSGKKKNKRKENTDEKHCSYIFQFGSNGRWHHLETHSKFTHTGKYIQLKACCLLTNYLRLGKLFSQSDMYNQ